MDTETLVTSAVQTIEQALRKDKAGIQLSLRHWMKAGATGLSFMQNRQKNINLLLRLSKKLRTNSSQRLLLNYVVILVIFRSMTYATSRFPFLPIWKKCLLVMRKRPYRKRPYYAFIRTSFFLKQATA